MFSSGIGADRKIRLETAQNKILMSIRPDTKGAFLSKVEVRSEISRLFFLKGQLPAIHHKLRTAFNSVTHLFLGRLMLDSPRFLGPTDTGQDKSRPETSETTC